MYIPVWLPSTIYHISYVCVYHLYPVDHGKIKQRERHDMYHNNIITQNNVMLLYIRMLLHITQAVNGFPLMEQAKLAAICLVHPMWSALGTKVCILVCNVLLWLLNSFSFEVTDKHWSVHTYHLVVDRLWCNKAWRHA